MADAPEFETRWIDAAATHDLRERILRPGFPQDVDFPGDTADATVHAGAFDARGQLVAIASMYHEPRPVDAPGGVPPRDEHATGAAWRLRGMAADPAVRRRGAGRAVLDACLEHVRAQGGTLAWCNARTPAIPFYESQGWTTLGEEFHIPQAGPHYVMELELTS